MKQGFPEDSLGGLSSLFTGGSQHYIVLHTNVLNIQTKKNNSRIPFTISNNKQRNLELKTST